MHESAVHAFRRIASKIHPPVALTHQESQRLLTALTSSFKTQLDSAHPLPDHRSGIGNAVAAEGRGFTNSFQSPTEQHLASILTNPLLARTSGHKKTSTLLGNNGEQRQPMEIFDQSVEQGTATKEMAQLCLQAIRKQLSALDAEERQRHIQTMQAGARVLRWIWSSDISAAELFKMETDHTPLRNRFIYTLVEFLVAEGREAAVWRWMSIIDPKVMVQQPDGRSIGVHPAAALLRSMVGSHLSKISDAGRETALRTFIRAVELKNEQIGQLAVSRSLLRPAACAILNGLENLGSSQLASLHNSGVLDPFLDSIAYWRGGKHPIIEEMKVAYLKMRHPSLPDPKPVLEVIRQLHTAQQQVLFSATSRSRPVLLKHLLEVAETLQSQRLFDDAAWVMDFTRRHFAEDLICSEESTEALRQRVAGSSIKRRTPDIEDVLQWRSPVPG